MQAVIFEMFGISSLQSQHLAPTLAGDVTVRSHWRAPVVDGVPDYSTIVIVDLGSSENLSSIHTLG